MDRTYFSEGAGKSKTRIFVFLPTFPGSVTWTSGSRLCPGDPDFPGQPGGRLPFDDLEVSVDAVGEYNAESRVLGLLFRCIPGESVSRLGLSLSLSLSFGKNMGTSGLTNDVFSSGVVSPSLSVSCTPDINWRTLPVLKRLDHEARPPEEPDDEREAASGRGIAGA